MTSSPPVTTSLLLSITLAFAACSSSDNDTMTAVGEFGGESASAVQIGLLLMAYPPELGGSAPLAFFQRLAEAASFDDVTAASNEDLDTCSVEHGEQEFEEIAEEWVDATSISAGESLTFRGAEGTYYTMLRRDNGAGGYFYQSDSFLTTPMQTGLTLDVPGDEFPAFTGVPIPEIEPLTGANVDERSVITVDMSFTWDSASSSESTIDLQLSGEQDGGDVTVLCELVDDGEFSLPPSTRAELGADFTATAYLGRSRSVIVRNGDAALILQLERDATSGSGDKPAEEETADDSGVENDPRFFDATIPSSARAVSLGVVSVVGEGVFDEAEVYASFYGLDRELPVDRLVESIVPPLDTCRIDRNSSTGSDGPEFRDDDGSDAVADFIDAGETITFTAPDGTWLTVPRRISLYFADYSSSLSDLSIPLPIPNGLVLDIPGDTFPTFANVPVADVTPLDDFAPASRQSVSAASSFSWTPDSASQAAYVGIVLFSKRASDDVSTVTCIVRDDGEFALPPATAVELGTGFSGGVLASRFSLTARLQDDALLIILNQRPAD